MALYLVSLQMRKQNLQGEQRLIHSQQMIFKLIEKEIFSGYSDAEQRFFVILSELNFFPRPLLLQVGDYVGVNAEALLADNVFVSYDQKAKNFYLHQVFLDYLSQKNDLLEAGLRDDMLCKSGDWCMHNQYYADAIDYYDRCGREDKVWQVISSFDGKRHTRDETALFIRYIEKFSADFLHQNILCQIAYSLLLFDSLRVDEALDRMRQVHAQLDEQADTPENRLLRGDAHFGNGLLSFSLGNPDFVGHFERAAKLLPNGSRIWGSKLELVEYSNALNLSRPGKGEIEKSIGRFFEAMPYIYKVLGGVGYGLEYLAAAEGHFLMGNLKQARQQAHQSVYMAEERQQADILNNALFLLLRIYLVTGETKHLGDILAQLQQKEQDTGLQLQGVSDIALGWFYSEIGEVQKVAGWILYSEQNNHPPISLDKDALLQIRCMIEEKNYARAIALSGRLERTYRKRNVYISMVYLYVYTAISHYQTGDMDSAEKALKDAYGLVKDDNLFMPFVEYGHRTRAMLDYFRKEGIPGIPTDWLEEAHTKASTYAKRHAYIVSQFKDTAKRGSQDFGLTSREVELLRNMSIGLTRDEIAASMYISPNTVKSMLKTVYNKIGAINSADAVRISISANLI
ncbi:MAG: response regulator transcription factor [Christensenellaceae bacterium]